MNLHHFTAFLGDKPLSTGPLEAVREAARPYADNLSGPLLVFAHDTGRQVDLDWREPRETPAEATKPGPGRPKLGVVSAEVTLLPRHWAWLETQPARASGTLRRLVESAMAAEADDPKKHREALGNILWAVAGNLPGFEEVSRALYGGDEAKLSELLAAWPDDLKAFVASWLSSPAPKG